MGSASMTRNPAAARASCSPAIRKKRTRGTSRSPLSIFATITSTLSATDAFAPTQGVTEMSRPPGLSSSPIRASTVSVSSRRWKMAKASTASYEPLTSAESNIVAWANVTLSPFLRCLPAFGSSDHV